ncbi:MAG: T9SS type A sorting domain-containing protein [Bacteroidota bacterium]|nr:T9SS type A sorting domain-containing protein [Bacteroidota bacterium]
MFKAILPKVLIFLILPLFGYSQPCDITSVSATPLSCNGFSFNVSVNLTVENPSSPGFTLAGNGIIYGTFLYSQLPVTVGPLLGDNESVYEFIAWDVENPECQNFTTMEAIDCGPICHFSNGSLELLVCIPPNHASVLLDFDHEGTTHPAFELYYADGTPTNPGAFLYESLPVQILSLRVNGNEPIELIVCDDNTDCCETIVLDPIDCNPTNCEIYNVNVDPECLVNNFVVHIDFEHENSPSDSFTLRGNSINYGTFAYTELPITVGPLNGNSSIQWEFVIRDSELSSCVYEYSLGVYHCPPPCDVLNFAVDPLLCISDDGYSLLLEMEIEGHGENGFSVFTEDGYYGTHAYEDLPLTLPFINGSGNFVDYVTVCDNDNIGCCASVGYEALLCAGCLIYNLEATPQPCTGDGLFSVVLDFDYTNVGSNGFTVSGNGTMYGTFEYEDLPIVIDSFDGSGSQFLEFVVADSQDEFCFAALEIGTLGCDDICDIFELTAEPGACTGNNTYIVEVDFGFENVSGNSFDLFANGEFYGFYLYADLPLTLLEFPGSGEGHDTIHVSDNDHPDCGAQIVFEAPSCECSIFDLSFQSIGCTTDSTFGVEVEFFYENLPGEFVDIFFDGVFQGFYNVNEIPILINLHEGSGTGVLQVCANDLNSCCATVAVELDSCEQAACHITDLFAEPGNCNSNESFVLDITFDTLNVTTDSVLIMANDSSLGKFLITPGFIRIINFPVYAGPITHLTVCSVGSTDCCDTFDFVTPDCDPNNCEIYDLILVAGDCTSDSTYSVVIEYNSDNIAGDSVIVIANGTLLDTFVAPDDRIEIENFPQLETNQTIITVCSVANPDCCDTYEFETQHCGIQNECGIDIGFVEFGQCFEDSTYILEVHFAFENLPTDSVIINSGDIVLGTYHVNEGQIIIEHFSWTITNLSVIRICAQGNENCCDVLEFETPDCDPTGCTISELIALLGECNEDSTFVLTLNFEFANLPTDSVVVDANGLIIGTYHVNEGHIIIADFPVFETNLTELHVCAQENADCCDVIFFETPCGTGCHLFDLFAEIGECTSDTSYLVDIVFQTNNFPGDSVSITANDLSLGNYLITPNFIRIENFTLLPGETTLITVCATNAPDCCDTYAIENPSCAGECNIFDLVVDVQDCNSDSTFGAIINFDWINVDAGGFDVYSGQGYLGFFNFDQIPILINEFPVNETGNYFLSVCESDNTQCCESIEFEGPVCIDICDINDMTYSITPCDSAGLFYFHLDFNFQHVGAEGFNVVGNGNQYGNFSYEDLPITLGPFQNGNTVFEFLVTDASNPTCFGLLVPGIVDCTTVATEEIEHIDIFEIFNNGSFPGIYAKQDISLTLFNANGKIISRSQFVPANSYFEMPDVSGGLYVATISYNGKLWPVKLIKASN